MVKTNSKHHYKIVCIVQIYNEIEKGNLERFFKYISPVVDEVVVYDDCSTDGSFEYALKTTPHVIRGSKNDFAAEINHKILLLEYALELKPKSDHRRLRKLENRFQKKLEHVMFLGQGTSLLYS